MAERKVYREAREKAARCAASPLGVDCGWCGPEGTPKRGVKAEWLRQKAGTPYPCNSKLLGKEVPLRGGGTGRIVGCATPLGESLLQTGKRSRRYKCQRAFLVKLPIGVEVPIPGSVVRERRRVREGNCPDAVRYERGMALSMEREATREGYHWMRGNDLPFPHRKGSTPCCTSASNYHGALEDLFTQAMEMDPPSPEFDVRVLDEVRRALPKHLRVTTRLRGLEDVPKAIDIIRDHCGDLWRAKEVASSETKRAYQKKISAAKRARRLQGWDTLKDGRVAVPARNKLAGRGTVAAPSMELALREPKPKPKITPPKRVKAGPRGKPSPLRPATSKKAPRTGRPMTAAELRRRMK